MISFETIIDLQEAGAKACELGASRKDNPFLRIVAMSGRSDEVHDHWRQKRDAWQFGWAIENAYRAVHINSQAA